MSLFTPPDISWRALRVWQRHRDVGLKLWKTESWPPFAEALFSLVAFGFGLGAYVVGLAEGSFIRFLAPGLAVQTALFAASFETSFGAYIRMENQRTFEAMIATPVSIEDVCLGEILWAATKACFATAAYVVVAAAFGLFETPWAVLIIPASFVGGILFGAIGLAYTAVTPSISGYNYFFTLFLTPSLLFGNTFFPIDQIPAWMAPFIWLLPTTHVSGMYRALNKGDFGWALWGETLWVAVVLAGFSYVAIVLMRRRLIR